MQATAGTIRRPVHPLIQFFVWGSNNATDRARRRTARAAGTDKSSRWINGDSLVPAEVSLGIVITTLR
jgi:hypothetical protein